MKKLLALLVLLFTLAGARAAAPIFLGSVGDYITNGAGTITFVFSNRAQVIFSRGATFVRYTNSVVGDPLILNFGQRDTNGVTRLDFSFGDSAGFGPGYVWELAFTSNSFYFTDGNNRFPLTFTRSDSTMLLQASLLPDTIAAYNLGRTDYRWSAVFGTNADWIGNTVIGSNALFTNIVRNFATNGSANTNLTLAFDQGVEDWYPTNNLSLTNFTGLDGGKSKSIVRFITPQLVNRTVVWPTLGGASFGSYWYTNDNSFMWSTLTSGVTYALSITTRGTNAHVSITKWK